MRSDKVFGVAPVCADAQATLPQRDANASLAPLARSDEDAVALSTRSSKPWPVYRQSLTMRSKTSRRRYGAGAENHPDVHAAMAKQSNPPPLARRCSWAKASCREVRPWHPTVHAVAFLETASNCKKPRACHVMDAGACAQQYDWPHGQPCAQTRRCVIVFSYRC